MSNESKDYKKGRADAAEGKNSPPSPDIVDHFIGYDEEKMATRREEYREGNADKKREMGKEK